MKNKFYMNGIFSLYKEEREKIKHRALIFSLMIIFWVVTEVFLSVFKNDYLNNSLISYIIKNTDISIEDINLIKQLFFTIIPILVFVFYSKFISKHSYESLGFSKKGVLKNYLIGSLVGLVMFSFCMIVGVTFRLQTITFGKFSIGLWLMFVFGFIIQGMSEEVMFRGVFFPEISSKFGIVVGIVVNSILFSMMHFGNNGISYLPAVNLFLFGVFMSLVYYYYQNLWIVGAIHSFWNFTQGNIFGVSVSGIILTEQTIFKSTFVKSSIFTGESFGTEGGLICTFLLIISILVVMYINKGKFLKEKN